VLNQLRDQHRAGAVLVEVNPITALARCEVEPATALARHCSK
jgi:hypothetical protein